MILCIRLAYFRAAVYRRRDTALNQGPFLIAGARTVRATDGRAAQAGVRPGITLRQAQALCPAATVVTEDDRLERQAHEQVLDLLLTFTSLVEIEKTDALRTCKARRRQPEVQQAAVFFLDWERLRQADTLRLTRQLGERLRAQTGFSAQLGVASTKFVAYAAATHAHPDHLLSVPPGEDSAFLSPLPLALLPLDEELARRLPLLGLTTLRELAAVPVAAVFAQYGKRGVFLWQLAHGYDHRRVVPERPRLVEQVERVFEEPISNRLTLEAVTRSVGSELAARLQAKGCMGRTLTLSLTCDHGTQRERQVTLRRPVAGTAHLIQTLAHLLSRIPATSGVTKLAVTLTNLIPFAGHQLDLFSHRTGQQERLNEALDNLTARYGNACFSWIVPADLTAGFPERRYQFQPVLPA